MRLVSAKKECVVPFSLRPTDSAHASTLLQLNDQSVLAAWFGGSWEKDCNVSIWIGKRTPQGIWETPCVAADVRGVAMWNPVLFRCPDTSILLFYKVGVSIDIWKTYALRSLDDGRTWAKPFELVEGDCNGGRGPVKNKPILLSDGKTIVAPASLEGETWDAFVDISKDNGHSWESSSFVPVHHAGYTIQMVDQPYDKHRCWGKGLIQPTLWEDDLGSLHMFCRSTSSAIFRSDSVDGGHTWNMAYETGLPNNNSGIDLVRMPQGTLVLAYNPVGNLPNYYKGPRTPLVLDYSNDNGLSWDRLLVLEDGPGDYAYPAIICTSEHSLMLTYTQKRELICFWDIEVEAD
jgi:predicted neuraminidase